MINYEALAEMQKNSSNDGNLFVDVSKLKPKSVLSFRVCPPQDAMNGIYYVEEKGYWINSKRYVTSNTFGGPDPLQKYIDEVEKNGTKEQKGLLKIWKNGFQKKSVYYVPVLILDVEYSRTGTLNHLELDQIAILQCGISVINGITKEVLSKYHSNDGDGICDIEKGKNFDLTKKISTNKDGSEKTEYIVSVDPNIIPMKREWYEGFPDLVEFVSKKIVDDEVVIEAFNNYIYGTPITKKEDDTKNAIAKNASKYSSDDEDDSTPTKKSKRTSLKDLMGDD